MSEALYTPPEFADLSELAQDALGGFVLYATDEFFAAKDNLLKRGEAVFDPAAYTDRGKLMDGWESMRRRTPGHDFAIIRLGIPGVLHGFLVDTAHFKGNSPTHVSIDVIELPGASTERLLAAAHEPGGWAELVPKTAVQPNFKNVVLVNLPRRATHVRLHIYPDGGVARLRVFGHAAPAPATFWRASTLDLAAIEHGGHVVRESNKFYGPPQNLLLPGRGVNMGDGWETARRRTPGTDWAVVALGRPGVLERVELDTHFFKGNAPQAVELRGLDARTLDGEALERALSTGDGFGPLVPKSPTEPHQRHALTPVSRRVVTHVRVDMYPHGGINRMRLFGQPIDTPDEQDRLDALAAMPEAERRALFGRWCAARRYVDAMMAHGRFPTVHGLLVASLEALDGLSEPDWLEAFDGHPKLGEAKQAARADAEGARLSSQEQSGVQAAAAATLARLAEGNAAYAARHGFIFILFASGRTAGEVLGELEARIDAPRAVELERAAGEQRKITQRRIEGFVEG